MSQYIPLNFWFCKNITILYIDNSLLTYHPNNFIISNSSITYHNTNWLKSIIIQKYWRRYIQKKKYFQQLIVYRYRLYNMTITYMIIDFIN